MLHLAQLEVFKPIINTLLANGSEEAQLVKQSGVADFLFEQRSTYAPVICICDLLNRIQKYQGHLHLLERYGDQITLDAIPDFADLVINSPDLLTACRIANQNDHVVFTHEQSVFQINGNKTIFGSYFDNLFISGHVHLELINLGLLVNAFRQLTYPTWDPLEIYFQQNESEGIEHLLTQHSSTEVKYNQPFTAVVFPTELLSRTITKNKTALLAEKQRSQPFSLANKITKLLESRKREQLFSLEEIATFCNVSSRTLRRKLCEEGTTYFATVDNWRLSKALNYLSDPNHKITEIPSKLGYANLSNFERAFRRWTKSSPRSFRETLSN